jgi:hypothetical protein
MVSIDSSLARRTPADRTKRTSLRQRKRPADYTFAVRNGAELISFARSQKVPAHYRPLRRKRIERWVLSRFLLAINKRRRLPFPVRIAHALTNRAPDFIVTIGSTAAEGYEVTQATTRKYQAKLERNEKRWKGEAAVRFGSAAGLRGHQAETYWCRQILKAVRAKLLKLRKGYYQSAARQHLLIYDDMEAFGVDHGEALRRVKQPLAKAQAASGTAFDSISIVTTQNTLLFDVSKGVFSIAIPVL